MAIWGIQWQRFPDTFASKVCFIDIGSDVDHPCLDNVREGNLKLDRLHAVQIVAPLSRRKAVPSLGIT